jgi:hypothetical protein
MSPKHNWLQNCPVGNDWSSYRNFRLAKLVIPKNAIGMFIKVALPL